MDTGSSLPIHQGRKRERGGEGEREKERERERGEHKYHTINPH